MLINLLAIDNYNSYNIELAKTVGLHEAIYLNEVINITEKAYRKDRIYGGYVTLDRGYIESRTTFDASEQKALQRVLQECNIMRVDENNVDKVSIDLNLLINMLLDGNESLLKATARSVKSGKKRSKAESIRDNLKSNINVNNNELRTAYYEWIDSVSNKRGYMDKKAVIEGQKVVDAYCNRDLDKALKVISIATINSYADMNWAVNAYKRDYANVPKKPPTIQGVQYLSSEVF